MAKSTYMPQNGSFYAIVKLRSYFFPAVSNLTKKTSVMRIFEEL